MKLVNQVNKFLNQDELLAEPTSKITRISVDREDGKFLPSGDRSVVLRIKSGGHDAVLVLSPKELDKFIRIIKKKGRETVKGVFA